MNISFTIRNTKISQEIRSEYENIIRKISSIFDRINSCYIILELENRTGANCKADIRIHIPQKTLIATELDFTFDKAILKAVHNLSGQLRHYKQRHFNNYR